MSHGSLMLIVTACAASAPSSRCVPYTMPFMDETFMPAPMRSSTVRRLSPHRAPAVSAGEGEVYSMSSMRLMAELNAQEMADALWAEKNSSTLLRA